MDLLAVWLGKITLLVLRLLGRRGNALPGLVVERLFPRYLPRAMARLAQGVVVVTGTNGKTTTTKMLATILGERYRVLTNDTGSNFVRGTITAAVEHSTWTGRLPYDLAVLELDEAWAVRFVALVPPRRALLLNVMRDQLDRFGEIDATAALLATVAAATTGHLVLNRDDPRVAALATRTGADVHYFGVAADLRGVFPSDEELYGAAVTLSPLPAVAELRTLPSVDDPCVTLRLVAAGDGDAHRAAVREQCGAGVGAGTAGDQRLTLRAEGPHNAQNAAAAAAVALTFGLDAATVVSGLAKVQPAFGRGQSFAVDGRNLVLHLVKNPAGFRQSLQTLHGSPADAVIIAINDEYADGRDVSWLWDVDFTGPAIRHARLSTSGRRAADMAVRLRYDEVPVDEVQPDLGKSVRSAVAAVPPGGHVAVFSTYTAMWSLHADLNRNAEPR
jgi:UDP-N-acetylmuramyl tripeptide synthase